MATLEAVDPGAVERLNRSMRVVWGTMAMLLLYGAVLFQNGPRNTREVFPVFNWDLFSRVPHAERDSYSIRLVEVNGRRLDRPVYFEKAGAYLPQSQSPDAYALMQQLGRSTDASRVAQADEARTLFEGRFLEPLDSASYELVRRRYDVLERVECDCFITESVIGAYTF